LKEIRPSPGLFDTSVIAAVKPASEYFSNQFFTLVFNMMYGCLTNPLNRNLVMDPKKILILHSTKAFSVLHAAQPLKSNGIYITNNANKSSDHNPVA